MLLCMTAFHPLDHTILKKREKLSQKSKNPETLEYKDFGMAGEEGFEPSAYGFGDRRSAS